MNANTMGSCSVTIVPESGVFGGRETTITEIPSKDYPICFHISAPAIATDYIQSFDHIEGHFGQHPLLTENDRIECTIDPVEEFMLLGPDDYLDAINIMIDIEMRRLRDELAWVLNGNFYLLKKLEIIKTLFKVVEFKDYNEDDFPVKFNPRECQKQIKGEVAYLVIVRPEYSSIIASVTLYCNGKEYKNFPVTEQELAIYINELQNRQPKIIPYPYA